MLRECVATFIFLIISGHFMNSCSREITDKDMDFEKDISKEAEMDTVPKKPPIEPETFYDYFMLTLNWPQTNCYLYQNKKLHQRIRAIEKNCSECNMPLDRYKWTIHGLWPSNNKLIWTPEAEGKILNCKKKRDAFNINADSPLANNLNTHLITFGRSENIALHLHEWNKHGTCVKDREDMNSQEKYFEKTIELFKKYDPSQYLKDTEIMPGQSYEFKKLRNVLKEFLHGAVPNITCVETVEGDQYLHEIRICLDKELLEPINCETPVNPAAPTLGVCDEKYHVIYPENKKPCPGRRSIS
ncbi:hypothetical protein TKK_0016305 [Trichogramma kaykai]